MQNDMQSDHLLRRLNAAAQAIATAVHPDGWRVRGAVQRDLAFRCYSITFRRLCEDGSIDALRLFADGDLQFERGPVDLEGWVHTSVAFLKGRSIASATPLPVCLDVTRPHVDVLADSTLLADDRLRSELERAYAEGKEAGRLKERQVQMVRRQAQDSELGAVLDDEFRVLLYKRPG